MGADRQAPGPQGRGPFTPDDAFVLPDGRKYVPGDACSDDIYGERWQLCCMSEQGPSRTRGAILRRHEISPAILRCVFQSARCCCSHIQGRYVPGARQSHSRRAGKRAGSFGVASAGVVHRSRLSSSIITCDAVRVQGRP